MFPFVIGILIILQLICALLSSKLVSAQTLIHSVVISHPRNNSFISILSNVHVNFDIYTTHIREYLQIKGDFIPRLSLNGMLQSGNVQRELTVQLPRCGKNTLVGYLCDKEGKCFETPGIILYGSCVHNDTKHVSGRVAYSLPTIHRINTLTTSLVGYMGVEVSLQAFHENRATIAIEFPPELPHFRQAASFTHPQYAACILIDGHFLLPDVTPVADVHYSFSNSILQEKFSMIKTSCYLGNSDFKIMVDGPRKLYSVLFLDLYGMAMNSDREGKYDSSNGDGGDSIGFELSHRKDIILNHPLADVSLPGPYRWEIELDNNSSYCAELYSRCDEHNTSSTGESENASPIDECSDGDKKFENTSVSPFMSTAILYDANVADGHFDAAAFEPIVHFVCQSTGEPVDVRVYILDDTILLIDSTTERWWSHAAYSDAIDKLSDCNATIVLLSWEQHTPGYVSMESLDILSSFSYDILCPNWMESSERFGRSPTNIIVIDSLVGPVGSMSTYLDADEEDLDLPLHYIPFSDSGESCSINREKSSNNDDNVEVSMVAILQHISTLLLGGEMEAAFGDSFNGGVDISAINSPLYVLKRRVLESVRTSMPKIIQYLSHVDSGASTLPYGFHVDAFMVLGSNVVGGTAGDGGDSILSTLNIPVLTVMGDKIEERNLRSSRRRNINTSASIHSTATYTSATASCETNISHTPINECQYYSSTRHIPNSRTDQGSSSRASASSYSQCDHTILFTTTNMYDMPEFLRIVNIIDELEYQQMVRWATDPVNTIIRCYRILISAVYLPVLCMYVSELERVRVLNIPSSITDMDTYPSLLARLSAGRVNDHPCSNVVMQQEVENVELVVLFVQQDVMFIRSLMRLNGREEGLVLLISNSPIDVPGILSDANPRALACTLQARDDVHSIVNTIHSAKCDIPTYVSNSSHIASIQSINTTNRMRDFLLAIHHNTHSRFSYYQMDSPFNKLQVQIQNLNAVEESFQRNITDPYFAFGITKHGDESKDGELVEKIRHNVSSKYRQWICGAYGDSNQDGIYMDAQNMKVIDIIRLRRSEWIPGRNFSDVHDNYIESSRSLGQIDTCIGGSQWGSPVDTQASSNVRAEEDNARSGNDTMHTPGTASSSAVGTSEMDTGPILCATYTISSRHHQLRSIVDTWGKRCDGYIAISNQTDSAVNAFAIPHKGGEIFHRIWHKVRSGLTIIHKYLMPSSTTGESTPCLDFNDTVECEVKAARTPTYEWIYVSGDDSFLIMDNLRLLLSSSFVRSHVEKYPFLGQPWNWNSKLRFNHGGAGYVLHRTTLDLLVKLWSLGHCHVAADTSMEDVMIANCLRTYGVFPLDTRDSLYRPKFHTDTPGGRYSRSQLTPAGFTVGMGSRWLVAEACCARDSVSFHYIKDPHSMRLLHYWIYKNTYR